MRYLAIMNDKIIYHMCKADEWAQAQAGGSYPGSSQDQADGFIHFSTYEQVWTSAAKHRCGQDGILLLAVDTTALGDALKWEASRGGALFPHLYGTLSRCLWMITAFTFSQAAFHHLSWTKTRA